MYVFDTYIRINPFTYNVEIELYKLSQRFWFTSQALAQEMEELETHGFN